MISINVSGTKKAEWNAILESDPSDFAEAVFALVSYVSDTVFIFSKHRKTTQNSLRQIRRVRSRTPQSYLMECLKSIVFHSTFALPRRVAINQAKKYWKRNCFYEFQSSSRKYFY